jgi:hypothetical protein
VQDLIEEIGFNCVDLGSLAIGFSSRFAPSV